MTIAFFALECGSTCSGADERFARSRALAATTINNIFFDLFKITTNNHCDFIRGARERWCRAATATNEIIVPHFVLFHILVIVFFFAQYKSALQNLFS